MSASDELGHEQEIDNIENPLDTDLQQELDNALGDMSLMDLVDQQEQTPKPSAEGLRRGTVVAVQRDDILVDMGGKSTGVLPLKQLGEEPIPAVGDVIEVVITGYEPGEGLLLLSRKDAVTAATWESIEVGQTVEGRVTGLNKGGLELKIDGIDAFMPASQVDIMHVQDISIHLNQRVRCEVMEIRRSEQSVLVSRRRVLKKESAEAREKLLQTLTEGKTVRGTVKSIMPYGAFVDIGGADGLLHIGEMGHGRVTKPEDVVHEGQQLEVMVLKVDRENGKIALGLKQILPDPWTDAETKWLVDSIISGRITRLVDFGAFVELEEGVEGLIPISEMSYEKRINHPKEVASENEVVKVRVLSVDTKRRRISLSIKKVGDDPWMGASVRWPVDSEAEGTVKRVTEFGAFVELAPGVEGLIHISELSDSRVRSVGDAVQEGQIVKSKVLSIDEERHRIALSIKKLTSGSSQTGSAPAESKPEPAKRKRKKALRGGLD